jgi:predicted nucleic acid-binding protein
MRRVLDSCVGFKWHIAEAGTDKALRLRDDFLNGIVELLAPDVFSVEIAHALTRAERQGRITPAEGALHLQDALATLPDLHPHLPLLPRAYEISSIARIGVYDCLYVALAEREGCDLITSDQRLLANLGGTFPFLVDLATLS